MALVAVASIGLVWAFSSVYQDPAIGIPLALPILGWRSVHRFRIPTKTCLARFPFAGSWNDLVCRPCFLESLSRHRRLSLGSTALSCHGSAALSQELLVLYRYFHHTAVLHRLSDYPGECPQPRSPTVVYSRASTEPTLLAHSGKRLARTGGVIAAAPPASSRHPLSGEDHLGKSRAPIIFLRVVTIKAAAC